MSSVILTNWTVYYSSDAGAGAGYKQIRWTGAGTPETTTNTVNELYSALMDLFSIAAQNEANDTTPMQAVTPTVYNLGAIDAGDLEPWFIDPVSVQHLTGGSIQTVGWTRSLPGDGTGNIGILMVQCSSTGFNMTSADIGDACTHGDADAGRILYVDTTNYRVWIRPSSNALANDFNSGSGTITATTAPNRTVTQTANGTTGERLWSNIYTIGTIESETQLYVTQSFTKFTPWWGSGHLDRLFLVTDGFSSGLIDRGILTVYARQYSKLYDHFSADISGGGRNPIPLATSDDSNNSTGYRKMTVAGSSGTWTVGNYIFDSTGGLTWVTTTRRGVITAVSGNDITYYLISNNIDFAVGADDTQEYTGSTNGDASATSISAIVDVGPTSSSLTVNFGYISRDIGDGFGVAPYSVEIDLLTSISLSNMYERVKFLTRPTLSPSDIDNGAQTIYGEQYVGVGDILLPYSSQSTGFTQGEAINGQTSGATGYVTADKDDGTSGTLTVRDVRGTFVNGENIRNVTTVRAVAGTPSAITPVKVSPFGTKAGSRFFGARGVWLKQVPGSDANNYEVIDNNGVSHSPPASIAITINNTTSGDRVSVFRAEDGDTSGNINTTYLTSHNTENAVADTTFVIDAGTPIPTDTPSAGVLRVVDQPGQSDHRYRYASWTALTFTLITTGIPTGNIDTVGSNAATSFREDNADLANILPGDMVLNFADSSWAHVRSVTLVQGETTIYDVVHTPLQGGTNNYWIAAEAYRFNQLVVAYNSTDTAYVPYLDQIAAGTSVSTSVQFASIRNITTRVRIKGMQPYNNHITTLTSSGYSTSVTRIPDDIFTSN